MDLKYKILWFDNDAEWVKSIEGFVKEIVEELGFLYECRLYITGASIDSIQLDNYDIILMDLNLDDDTSGDGDQLINKIRSLDVYTDVLFYSADGLAKIKEKAQALGLEGVYFSGRSQSSFISKLRKVINTTIKKVQDLNNLRGLVMAEVSELDAVMDRIILSYFNMEERMALFHKHITANREKTLRDSLNCANKCQLIWRDKDIQEIVPRLDSSQKARAIKIIIEQSRPDLYSEGNFYEEYNATIITPRNELAHCKSEIREGKEMLLTRNGDKCFDETFFKEIRKNILKYSGIFNELLQ